MSAAWVAPGGRQRESTPHQPLPPSKQACPSSRRAATRRRRRRRTSRPAYRWGTWGGAGTSRRHASSCAGAWAAAVGGWDICCWWLGRHLACARLPSQPAGWAGGCPACAPASLACGAQSLAPLHHRPLPGPAPRPPSSLDTPWWWMAGSGCASECCIQGRGSLCASASLPAPVCPHPCQQSTCPPPPPLPVAHPPAALSIMQAAAGAARGGQPGQPGGGVQEPRGGPGRRRRRRRKRRAAQPAVRLRARSRHPSCHLAPRLASVLPAPSSSALANLALHSKDKCRSNQRAQERRNQAQVLPPKTVPLPPVHLSSSAQLAPAPAEARPTTCSPTVRLRAPSSSTSITDWRLRGEAGTVMEGL